MAQEQTKRGGGGGDDDDVTGSTAAGQERRIVPSFCRSAAQLASYGPHYCPLAAA